MNEIQMEVWGDFACFSRPESKVERLTYPVMTLSAARGILSAVYSKPPEFYWQVKKIEVLHPIRYMSFKRNEVINSKISSNPKEPIFVDETKAEVIFNLPDKEGNCKREQKQKFYLDALAEAAQHDSMFAPAVSGFQVHIDAIRETYLSDKKKKSSDFLSIKIDGKPLESSTGYLECWESFRKQFDTKKSSGEMRCFITGALTEPIKTVPPVSGLNRVGGHTKGDSFICFDKDAYKS